MRNLLRAAVAALLALPGCSRFLTDSVEKDATMDDATIHQVEFDLIDGTRTSFGDLGGEVVLVVNTASECGFTPQYDGLEALYQEYRDRGLVVVGFPSDDFGGQEPGSAAEIAEFCRVNHGVTFPLAAKVRVKEGPEQSPVYRFLGKASGSLPAWNFGKYLVGRDGRVVGFFASNVAPGSRDLRAAIDEALAG